MTNVPVLDGTLNFRDTGGMPLARGGRNRYGVLYRSDALSSLTADGLRALADSRIRVIVDLRTTFERDNDGADRLPNGVGFRMVQLPLLEGAFTAPGSGGDTQLPSLGEIYISMLSGGQELFTEIARQLIDPGAPKPGGVLIHCTAGKDRTGVAIALLLDAIGVRREYLLADYHATEANLAGEFSDRFHAKLKQFNLPLTPELEALATTSPPAAIEQALNWLDVKHGGGAGYLLGGGLRDDELAALRERLTQGSD